MHLNDYGCFIVTAMRDACLFWFEVFEYIQCKTCRFKFQIFIPAIHTFVDELGNLWQCLSYERAPELLPLKCFLIKAS